MKYAVERPFSWQWWSKLAPVRDGFDALLTIKNCKVGGSPGLVIVEGDSCSKGCGFESWRRILDGHFFTLICGKNCIVCLKRLEINDKEARDGPFFKI